MKVSYQGMELVVPLTYPSYSDLCLRLVLCFWEFSLTRGHQSIECVRPDKWKCHLWQQYSWDVGRFLLSNLDSLDGISSFSSFHGHYHTARRGGAAVAGWTLDRKIRVRFPAYPHRVWALWWQGGKRRPRTSRCPCQGRLGTLKTPSCPWRGCPAAGQNLETGHLSRHYIAEISLNVTLNHNQQQQHYHTHLY